MPADGVRISPGELFALQQRITGRFRPGGRTPFADGPGHARQQGRGMEFAEVRAYQPGDDVRSIDWRHTARRGKPYTKLYHEEAGGTLQLVVDASPGMQFGTRSAFKSVQAARAAMLLAWAAAAAGDRIGGCVWNGMQLGQAAPRARQQGAHALIRLLTDETARTAPAPGFPALLQALVRSTGCHVSTVIISDFRHLDAAGAGILGRLRRQADIAFLQVYDIFEAQPPQAGIYRVTDGEEERILDLRTGVAREAYRSAWQARQATLRALAAQLGAPLHMLATHEDPILALDAVPGLAMRLAR